MESDDSKFNDEFYEIDKLYDECIGYLKNVKENQEMKIDLMEKYELVCDDNVIEGKINSDDDDDEEDYLENYNENFNSDISERKRINKTSDTSIDKVCKTQLKYENELEMKSLQSDKITDNVEAVNITKIKAPRRPKDDNEIENNKVNTPKNNESNLKNTEAKFNETSKKHCKKSITKQNQKNNSVKQEKSSKTDFEETQSEEDISLLSDKENKTLYSRLRRLSQQLPKIIITKSNNSISSDQDDVKIERPYRKMPTYTNKIYTSKINDKPRKSVDIIRNPLHRMKVGYGDFPRRLVSKNGIENVALISNVPYEKLRLLNDTFHTLINLRWRWIVSGTIVVHFLIWLVFAVFWYITALAHYDFEPDPPKRACVTGGKDFVTIFLASVEAQTTIGFGDRTIDEECPESIFLFIMQLILGTGLSGVLTCVVYAKLTRPEKLSRDGVGFSKNAVISIRDGRLCLMIRAWDLNYDHIISSDFSAHFIKTHRTKEGEVIRYYARTLDLQQHQFLIWPVTLVHVIDETSPLFYMTPLNFAEYSYEITVSLKGASASMGTFTQSQTSYLPKEVMWGYRFPGVVKYDRRKQKYVIEHKKLNLIEPIATPLCSADQLYFPAQSKASTPSRPCTPGSFSEKMESFHLERQSSFRKSK